MAILFQNPNFLILDEPTNDLDLPTLSVLENFLSDFQGCLLIVSHDRYFMDRLVDHLFVFEGNGAIRDYPGNYSTYRIEERAKEKGKDQTKEPQKEMETTTQAPVATAAPAKRKWSFKEKREFELLEKEIAKLDEEKTTITEKMMNPNINYDEIQKISFRITQITQLLEQKELRWLALSELEQI